MNDTKEDNERMGREKRKTGQIRIKIEVGVKEDEDDFILSYLIFN